MFSPTHHFALALFRPDGSYLGTVPAELDFGPAHEWTRFRFQRRGELPLEGDSIARVVPLWNRAIGEPCCRGYRVEILRDGEQPVNADFPFTHFGKVASSAASLFVEKGLLVEGDQCAYRLLAFPAENEPPEPGGITVSNASPGLPTRDGSLDALRAWATPAGVEVCDDMPVFVSRQVLREAQERTLAQRGTETGGILIGNLWRDTDCGEIFAEVTAQIPAEHTHGTDVKLTFTAQTWAAVDAALRLRGLGECYLGYYHSHPVHAWCSKCEPEKQKTCRLAKGFFSSDDEAVMRAAFPRAYSIALVVNDTAFGISFSMFGNREGQLQPRGYYVMED